MPEVEIGVQYIDSYVHDVSNDNTTLIKDNWQYLPPNTFSSPHNLHKDDELGTMVGLRRSEK